MSKKIQFKEVYVSIVTVPRLDSIEPGTKDFDRFKRTYTDYKEYMNDKQIIQSYHDDAGKSLAFAKVFQIALGFTINDDIRIVVLTGEEVNVISKFHDLLITDFSEAKLYGYNLEFIYNMLKMRGRVNGISEDKEAPQFKDIGKKPWNRKLSVTLMDELASGSSKLSLINALYAANLDYSNIVEVDDISVLLRSGDLDAIHSHGAFSVKGVADIKRFLAVEPPIQGVAHSVVKAITEKKTVNVLDHLLASGSLTNNVLTEVVSFTNKHKLDKESVYELVVAALAKTAEYNTVDKDTKAEIREALGLISLKELKDIEKEKKKQKELEKFQMISAVVEKGNLGKKEATALIKDYKDESDKIKKSIVELTEKFLTRAGKIEQQRTSAALKYLKEQLSYAD